MSEREKRAEAISKAFGTFGNYAFETLDQEQSRIFAQQSRSVQFKPGYWITPRPQAEEIWHVRLPGETALRTVKITETTANTVRFHDVNVPIGQATSQRYEHSDVKFVEKSK